MAEKGVKPTVEKKQDKKAKPEKAKPEKKVKPAKAPKPPKKPKPPKPEKKQKVKGGANGAESGKDGKKKLILVIVIVILAVLVGIGGFFAWKTIQDDKKANATKEESSESQPVKTGFLKGDKEQEASTDSTQGNEGSGGEETPGDTASADASSAAPTDAAPASPEEIALSVETAQKAVDAVVNTANLSAMLGAGVSLTDAQAAPADGESSKKAEGDSKTSSKEAKSEEEASGSGPKVVAGSHAESAPGEAESASDGASGTQEETSSTAASSSEPERVKDFKFSEETLTLPPFRYSTSDALEAAVHRDIQKFLTEKDSRPGVQMESAVICAKIPMSNGATRVLAYIWGTRYAVAENTLFDYGSLAGPCAMDYTYGAGGYQLQDIKLAHSGDSFETSVQEFCGDRQDIAENMIAQAYNLEMRGQMLRNVTNYIRENSTPVEYFRMAGQVYNKDGTVYLPETPESSASQGESASVSEEAAASSSLKEEYQYYKDLPQ